MRYASQSGISLFTMSMALYLALTPAQDRAHAQTSIERQRQEQARPEIEKERKNAEQQARKTLDKDAIAAIDETRNAIAAIRQGNKDEALAAIERATGKINILLARNPATALIPAAVEVEIIDAAPLDVKAIKARAETAEDAVDEHDFPLARVILYGLTSEIRVRSENLPLGTYPAALKEAARLLDQSKTQEANAVLLAAVRSFVMIERVIPLPVVVARAAIDEAQAVGDKDKKAAQNLLATATEELERARELGYVHEDDEEYASLHQSIASLEKQLNGNEDTASTFAKLKQSMEAFFQRLSKSVRGNGQQG